MKARAISSRWLHRGGRRLDAPPYLSGAPLARMQLEASGLPTQPLRALTRGGDAGIFHVGRTSRRWVPPRVPGVPFLGSADILRADLSTLPRISSLQAARAPNLLLREGWTLITRSGTVGRAAYARAELDGLACSEHVLRVVPAPGAIPPGYLFAYLRGRHGNALLTEGTYGAVIQHIEPSHVAALPVPRLGDALEREVHALVTEAADARSRAATLRVEATRRLTRELGLPERDDSPTVGEYTSFTVSSAALQRLDAAHHNPACAAAQRELARCAATSRPLETLARVFTPPIFKRPRVDDPALGYPYFSGSELFQHDPAPRGFLRRAARGIERYRVERDWLLLQDAGQLGGLIGHVVRVSPRVAGGVVSNHLIRVVPRDPRDAAYLYALLDSPHGYRSVTRHAFGSSIPQLDPRPLSALELPWPDPATREKIAAPIRRGWSLRDRADEAERAAVARVEAAVEQASRTSSRG